jgi:two-component system chemotaxis response regulator CheB
VALVGNGRVAVDRFDAVQPDVVILDVEMPEMDGLGALAELKKRKPRLPIIMFSSHTERGAATTLDALALGASDYLYKPSSLGLGHTNDDEIRAALIAKVKLLTYRPIAGKGPSSTHIAKAFEPTRIDMVAIGISTGGPNALAELFKGLTEPLPVPIMIVQHMPAVFTKRLAERLDVLGGMRVEEGAEGPGDLPLWARRDGGPRRGRDVVRRHERALGAVTSRQVGRVLAQRCVGRAGLGRAQGERQGVARCSCGGVFRQHRLPHRPGQPLRRQISEW